MRGKTGDAMDRPGWRSSFLGDPGAIFLCGKLGRGTKKEKSSKKERTEGLWKLTLLMEIRKGRGFPQPLEKSLAKDARPFHSSHRPNNKDLFTIIYCRHDQKPWNGMCANSKLSQQRGSPQTAVPTFVPTLLQTRWQLVVGARVCGSPVLARKINAVAGRSSLSFECGNSAQSSCG
jgi:hypothetical protein